MRDNLKFCLKKSTMASVEGEKGIDAFEILHEYAWLEVFKRVEDPQDKRRLYNTCIRFRNLLEPSKCSWGLSLILPHIAPYFTIRRIRLGMISPPLTQDDLSYLDWNSLLHYRLVCKAWSSVISDFLSTPACNLRTPGDCGQYRLIHAFERSTDIEEFQEIFGTWKKNPFPGRTVAIKLIVEDESGRGRSYTRLMTGVPKMLEEFGIHIQSLLLNHHMAYSTSSSCVDHCKIISKILKHLPNIRRLALPLALREFNEEQMRNYFIQNPLPHLPFLEDLEMNSWELYRFHLQKYCPQLKTYSSMILKENDPARLLLAEMTRLEKLTLNLWGMNETNLDYLKELHSPLKKLDVVYRFTTDQQETFHIDKLLHSIRHLPVEEVRIELSGYSYGSVTFTESRQLSLDLYKNSTIRYLNLRSYGKGVFISFNFLQALTKAEVIELCHKHIRGEQPKRHPPPHPSGTPVKVRLPRFSHRKVGGADLNTKMYKSNIWEKMPSLKTLHVHGSQYRRVYLPGPEEDEFSAKFFRRL